MAPFHWDAQSVVKPWPLPNVWLGTSIEDQAAADARIPHLLNCPAAVRFLSVEPMLGPVSVDQRVGWLRGLDGLLPGGIHWIIAGGESGPGARPMHPDWARSVRDQCQAAGVPFYFKQWGAFVPGSQIPDITYWEDRASDVPYRDDVLYRVGKARAGRELDGVLHDGFPGAGS